MLVGFFKPLQLDGDKLEPFLPKLSLSVKDFFFFLVKGKEAYLPPSHFFLSKDISQMLYVSQVCTYSGLKPSDMVQFRFLGALSHTSCCVSNALIHMETIPLQERVCICA